VRESLLAIPGVRLLAGALGLLPGESRGFLLDHLPKGSEGAEVGVHLGDFSRQILDHVAPRKLRLIDPWLHVDDPAYARAWYGGKAEGGQAEMDLRHRSVEERFEAEIRAGQVEIQRGTSQEIAARLPDDSLDWVYIDGDHTYEFVRADLESFLRIVRPGGLLTGDDYVEGAWWKGGVKRAVDEFIEKEAVEVVAITGRQFILRKLDR
jgi:SAM-dependent methyltransferase